MLFFFRCHRRTGWGLEGERAGFFRKHPRGIQPPVGEPAPQSVPGPAQAPLESLFQFLDTFLKEVALLFQGGDPFRQAAFVFLILHEASTVDLESKSFSKLQPPFCGSAQVATFRTRSYARPCSRKSRSRNRASFPLSVHGSSPLLDTSCTWKTQSTRIS